ncbi:MAG: co-chaperone GroES [Clostridia bacterium]|nr:co-chaperone GroES [Clostridia bacterium]MBO7151778.1 co-chaperone GroES [Clostridia bacterium]MBO7221726.1 co-chaperone GroES [Clostridia bacterium]MBO7325924.1 co-chaperone GroES [Clostridia bacterium]MBR5173446.1 co-chaperone GroES [Clostridia bacterium]
MTLKPLFDRVVIKAIETEERTASGIVLPGSAQEKPQLAEVIAVGPGTDETKMVVKVGDKVVYSKYAGSEIKLDNKEVVIIRQTDILAIVE